MRIQLTIYQTNFLGAWLIDFSPARCERLGVYVWEQLQKEPAKAFDPATFKPCANAPRAVHVLLYIVKLALNALLCDFYRLPM